MTQFENYIFNGLADYVDGGCFIREVSTDTFEMIEFSKHSDLDEAEIKHSIISYDKYSMGDIQKELDWTDYSLDDIKKEFGDKYKQAICECLFDSHYKLVFTGNISDAYKFMSDKYGVDIV